jgi:predicted RNA methylase
MRYVIVIAILLAVITFLFVSMGGLDWVESRALQRTMETDSRRHMLKVDQVVEKLNVVPGQKIADIGAGTGLFTWPLARLTAPKGIVYAVDINPFLLKNISAKAGDLGQLRIRAVRVCGRYLVVSGR